jgi:hypothetical protein
MLNYLSVSYDFFNLVPGGKIICFILLPILGVVMFVDGIFDLKICKNQLGYLSRVLNVIFGFILLFFGLFEIYIYFKK